MRRSEVISRIFGLLVLALLLTWLAEDAHGQATDTYIGACASQQSCTLAQNVSWATGNQVWRFTAYQPNESIRVWIWNHNPTNGHSSQTVQVWVTDDGTVPSLLNNADRWVQACVTDNSTTGAQLKNVSANNPTATPGANGKATGYTVGMYAVQIAVRITGAAAQAGNPDTFDIGIVQQPTTYPGGPQPGCDSSTGGPGLPGRTVSGVVVDPCTSAGAFLRSSVAINITSATTTLLVAGNGTQAIFVCGFDFTISQVVTTANTLQFEQGAGATCNVGTTALTGLYGAGGVTAAAPIHIQAGGGNGTVFSLPVASNTNLCAVTAIGASGSFQGVLTFVII